MGLGIFSDFLSFVLGYTKQLIIIYINIITLQLIWLSGVDTRFKPPIICMYRRKSKKKIAQPMTLWMEPVSNWA